jgi:serine/threonine-protein kinase
VLFLLVVAGGLIVLAMRLSDSGTKTAKVPDVINQNVVDVLPGLQSKFNVVQKPGVNQNAAAGKIYDQDPKGQQEVPEGSTLTLFVSTGNGEITVDDVRGLTFDQAKSKIDSALTVVRLDEASDTVDKDKVIDQDPQPGTKLGKGAKVTLRVSTGKSAIAIPDVKGLASSTAINTLRLAGFTNIVRAQEPSSEFPRAGSVTRTDPPIGTQVDKNAQITVYESTGPQATTTSPTTTAPTTTTATTQPTKTTTTRQATSTTDG